LNDPQTGVFKIQIMANTVVKKENPIKWLFRYVNESREEMKKVQWPNKKEVTKYSLITIAIALVVAAFFGGLDWILNQGLELLIRVTS
jgi:preprotein translocase subunit SecE